MFLNSDTSTLSKRVKPFPSIFLITVLPIPTSIKPLTVKAKLPESGPIVEVDDALEFPSKKEELTDSAELSTKSITVFSPKARESTSNVALAGVPPPPTNKVTFGPNVKLLPTDIVDPPGVFTEVPTISKSKKSEPETTKSGIVELVESHLTNPKPGFHTPPLF